MNKLTKTLLASVTTAILASSAIAATPTTQTQSKEMMGTTHKATTQHESEAMMKMKKAHHDEMMKMKKAQHEEMMKMEKAHHDEMMKMMKMEKAK
ncbi:hypothetical protein [Acinetobacter sp. ANC 4648]|uniref:hypothetical protein n=1 Tax=Acinetobacter sp. ANC 4648 TaxID=1977875 RepID=UPI000A335D76|nr:hypothetical protein [Acinetobacter sp. ANC 4648]OTG81725.1 hypothetical protein B9T27_10705 [Acinetobacter sp. ANC 4648]